MRPVVQLSPLSTSRALAAAALAATFAFGGCSSDDDVASSTTLGADLDTTTSSSLADTAVTDDAVLPDAVALDAAVLGAGWSATPGDAAAVADAALVEVCPSIARLRAEHEPVARDRVELRQDDAALPTVSDDLAVYADENAAAAVFNVLVGKAMTSCLPKLVADAGLPLAAVKVARVEVPDSGDAVAAIRLSGASIAGGLVSQVTVELVVVQRATRVHTLVITASDLFPLTAAGRTAIVEAAGA